MANTDLYNVLYALNETDNRLWDKISGVIGEISGAIGESGYVVMTTSGGLGKSEYKVDDSSTFNASLYRNVVFKLLTYGSTEYINKLTEEETAEAQNYASFLTKDQNALLTKSVVSGFINDAIQSANASVDYLESKLSSAFTGGKVVVGTTSGLTSSSLTLGSDTDTTLSGTNAVATEKAVKSYVDGLSGKVSGAFGTDNNNYIVTSKNGGIQKSSYLVGTTTSGSFGTANRLATEAGAKNYTDGKIDILSGALEQLTVGATTYQLSAINATSGYAASYQLMETKNGETIPLENSIINIPKDQFLSAAVYNASTESIDLTFAVSGYPTLTSIPVTGLVHEFEGVSGVAINYNANGTKSQIKGVVDSTSEAFLTVGANGFKISGVSTAINNAVTSATSGLSNRLDTVEGNITTLSSDLGTATGNIATLSSGLGTATGNITTLSSNLGTLSGKVSSLETKTGDTITSGHLVASNGTKYVDSGMLYGADNTLSSAFGVNHANTLATEVATKNYVAGAIAAANSSASGAYIPKVTGENGEVPKFKSDGTLESTNKTVGNSTTTAATFGTANVLADEAAVKNFVEDGLSSLLTKIEALQEKITGNQS